MNNTTILIGNGVNQLTKTRGLTWSELLAQIQRDLNTRVDLDNDFKPLPLAFEEILFTNCHNYQSRIRQIKQGIGKAFIKIEPNDYHRRIINSGRVSNIITTNYDYAFEKVHSPSFPSIDIQTAVITKEWKYSLRRVNTIRDKKVWHIHGEVHDPKNYRSESKHYKEESIIIGYEHYSESLKAMQDYKSGRSNKARIPFMTKLRENTHLGNCWMDFFFTDTLYIIGLDLGFSEIDLWWLLNYRARLLKENSRLLKRFKGSKIIYVFPDITSKDVASLAKREKIKKERIQRDLDKAKAKAELLKAFEVEQEPIRSKDYFDFYDKFMSKHLD